MLIANSGHLPEFHNYTKKVSRNIRTARVVTEILLEYFFPAIRCKMVRFDSHPRRRELRANVYIISPIPGANASDIERRRQALLCPSRQMEPATNWLRLQLRDLFG